MAEDRFKFRIYNVEQQRYVATEFDKQFMLGSFIIEQCTGLKDKNGNLIYEGDILLCDRKIVDGAAGTEIHYKVSGVVQREKNGKYFINGKDWYGSDITFYNEYAEIIGNIHEQKEKQLKCPFCQQELNKDPDGYYTCYTDNCGCWANGGNGASGSESLWLTLIDTKKKLDVCIRGLDQMTWGCNSSDAEDLLKQINKKE